jgi:hypothetical protein
MLLQALDPKSGPKLLYAAQVALSSLNQETKEKKHRAACPPIHCETVVHHEQGRKLARESGIALTQACEWDRNGVRIPS